MSTNIQLNADEFRLVMAALEREVKHKQSEAKRLALNGSVAYDAIGLLIVEGTKLEEVWSRLLEVKVSSDV